MIRIRKAGKYHWWLKKMKRSYIYKRASYRIMKGYMVI